MKKTRTEELEEQLAHIQWLKNNRERRIQQELERCRETKKADTMMKISVDISAEKSCRLNAILNDEFKRPLVLTDGEFKDMEIESSIYKERLDGVSLVLN